MNDFKDMSDRYRQQMMDIYNRYPRDTQQQTNTNSNNTTNNTTINIHTDGNTTNFSNLNDTGDIFSNAKDNVPIQGNTNTTDISNGDSTNDLTDDNVSIEDTYPEPVLPPYVYQSNHANDIDYNVPKQGTGYLKVVTSSAYRTIPLANVSVIVSQEVDGKQEILYSLLTNDSGETEVVELLTPLKNLSESPSTSATKPYAEYSISTYLNGYYQVINQKVPLFDGITSIQNVNMVPLPAHTEGRVVNTITIPEKEPNL